MKNNRGKLASPRGWLSRLVRFLTPRRRNMVEMTSPRLGQLLDVSRELDRRTVHHGTVNVAGNDPDEIVLRGRALPGFRRKRVFRFLEITVFDEKLVAIRWLGASGLRSMDAVMRAWFTGFQ